MKIMIEGGDAILLIICSTLIAFCLASSVYYY